MRARQTDRDTLTRYLSFYNVIEYFFEADRRKRPPERIQLLDVIRRCVADTQLAAYLADPTLAAYFADGTFLANLPAIDRNATNPISEQVANRIYDLRCEIVHTKKGGISGNTSWLAGTRHSLLLPDAYLIERVTRDVLIASATPLDR
jgi:hypothetical protein